MAPEEKGLPSRGNGIQKGRGRGTGGNLVREHLAILAPFDDFLLLAPPYEVVRGRAQAEYPVVYVAFGRSP